ncbi:MAG: MFS transporter [Rudaea sp.]|uniref:MFS transporter n=1 Tax=unclassified Rudaea TaxID=2627037 RepID=UPI001ACD3846|nr:MULTISPECIES: MFS transporter [unclassified Rudaea]MBN8884312.1 MFS transporter [Rudaea sp.]
MSTTEIEVPVRSADAAALMRPVPTRLFAFAVGVIILNLFSSQPLVDVIGPSLGLDARLSGFVTLSVLLGYAAGLMLLVPLSDLVENRRLALAMLGADALALCAAALAPSALWFLIAAFALGAAISCIQVLMPLAATLAPEAQRGRVVGDVMSGMMVGVLFSRPLASLAADALGWRGMYFASAAVVCALIALLAWTLPRHRPQGGIGYGALIASLWQLLRSERVLRVRALETAMMFAAFNLFWTTIALLLAEPPFELGPRGIALFALAGVSGAVVAPLAGRWGDRGWAKPAFIGLHALAIQAMILAAFAYSLASTLPTLSLGLLVVSAVLLDAGVVGDQALGRRAVNLLRPEVRGRLNGLFTGIFFLGGAAGSALTGFAWKWGGWNAVCFLAGLFACAALAISWSTLRDPRV